MDKGGYLYIITNIAFPDWVKVGTTDNLTKRLSTYQTGDPFRGYTIVYSIHHPKYLEAEKQVKTIMKPFASEIRNEWYKINLPMAKSNLDEVISQYPSTSEHIF